MTAPPDDGKGKLMRARWRKACDDLDEFGFGATALPARTPEQIEREREREWRRKEWIAEERKRRLEKDRLLAALEGDQARVDLIVEHLTESHLWEHGGYPAPGRWFRDQFFYVSGWDQDGGGKYASIEKISRRQMLAWYERARQFFRDHENERFSTALYETEASGDDA